MAAKINRDLSDDDRSQLADLGAALQRNGVRANAPSPDLATDSPSHTKESWSMRGRARDLAVEKDGKPEIIPHNQTTWAERLSASRTAGPSKGSTDHQPSSQQAPPQAAHETKRDDRTSATKSATSEPAQEAGQTKAGWADREKANRTEGKRSGQESFVEKLAQERESGKATTPKARTTPARGQDKSHDHER